MTYEDPRSGRDRNLGQDDVATSTGSWIAGAIVVAAVALGAWYYYDSHRNVADVNRPASTVSETSQPGTSGTTTGPAATDSSATGASSGTAGNTTQPAQDSTGVQGTEGNKNSPATTAPTNP